MTRRNRVIIFLAVGLLTLVYARKELEIDWFSWWPAYAAKLYERSGQSDILLGALDVLVHAGPFLALALGLGYGFVFIKHNMLRHEVLVNDQAKADYPRAEKDPRRSATPAQRKEVFERDGYKCVFCGRGVFEGSFSKETRGLATLKVAMGYQPGHVGHVIAWDLGGETETPNLVTTCEFCNLSAGKRLVGKYLDLALRVLRARRKTLWRGAL